MSKFPLGIHATFQVLWLVGVAIPLAAKANELAHRPSADAVLSIVTFTGIWAVVAGLAWGLRVVALIGYARWGRPTRRRVRTLGRRGRPG